MASTYGVSRDKLYYEPADAALPTENLWSTAKYLRSVPKLFEQLRERSWQRPHLLHDVHHRLTPSRPRVSARSLEPYRLFWMEDATPAENQETFRLIRQHTVTPLAVGEVFNTIWDCKQLIEEQLIDYIRTTVVHAGGITHLRRIADFAGLHNVRTGCHGATDLSPVCMGAALHLDTACRISACRNTCGTRPKPTRSSRTNTLSTTATCTPAKHPATASTSMRSLPRNIPTSAHLPVNRLEDGTLWNW